MLYSKNGSIPQPHTDGTEGWIVVPEPPSIDVSLGLEIVWWYPPGWVIRTPKPEDTETTVWKWSQTDVRWVEYNRTTDAVAAEAVATNEELPPA